jgi:peptide/nickel transport system ATP-binding protein
MLPRSRTLPADKKCRAKGPEPQSSPPAAVVPFHAQRDCAITRSATEWLRGAALPMASSVDGVLLEIRDLTIEYENPPRGRTTALHGISFQVCAGECLAILGESGSGKSTLALSILRLLPSNGFVVSGRIDFRGQDLLAAPERVIDQFRGAQAAMIFQQPDMALNPLMRAGRQVAEIARAHRQWSWAQCEVEARSILSQVFDGDVDRIYSAYPHELSGGERQRVCIAQALVCNPAMIIADEPTAALDVALQGTLLDIFQRLKQTSTTSLLLITHNAAILPGIADRVLVLREGHVVQQGKLADMYASPADPYTAELLCSAAGRASDAAGGTEATATTAEAIVEVRDLSKEYVRNGLWQKRAGKLALDCVDFTITRKSVVALVGPSGAGKSTLARCIVGIEAPTRGDVFYRGTNVAQMDAPEAVEYRRRVQLVFQEPAGSLNPRFSAADAVAEPLRIGGMRPAERRRLAMRWIAEVGLPAESADRPALEFSGGQRQRLGIARALTLRPEVIVFDEAFSALDLPVQSRILELLQRLRHTYGLTYVFISHDLTLLARVCTDVAVLYGGTIVERASTRTLLASPAHPYSKELVEAMPHSPIGTLT